MLKRGNLYTMKQIEQMDDLPDAPFHSFWHEGIYGVIQTSHLTTEELLSVPGIAESLWRYEQTTHEDVPVFYFHSSQPDVDITNFVDLEMMRGEERHWWATPKGFPREQYKDLNND